MGNELGCEDFLATTDHGRSMMQLLINNQEALSGPN